MRLVYGFVEDSTHCGMSHKAEGAVDAKDAVFRGL